MSLQITTTSGDPDKPDQIIAFAEPDPPTGYKYTDGDGDRIGVWPADIPDAGHGVNIRTDRAGCSIPAGEVEAFIQAVRDAAAEDGTGTETHPGVAAELEHAQATLARVHDVLGQLHSMAAGTMFPAYRDACLDVAGLLVAALKGGEQ